ncbi:hypothetical protein F4813DRAFT_123530 [Daldinia decipiens]|uniref:uncharacterized protein n=1 Tax=Daldinia decipiens TaxID=326647 RepID=UPI0020C2364B|nr:uncharacterized protein F4813DRAFT_123530 [Daldinia decipiens]KAI1656738.1 hypothetical protein F4813DRAFT_123530 [Daldinia decipiens]
MRDGAVLCPPATRYAGPDRTGTIHAALTAHPARLCSTEPTWTTQLLFQHNHLVCGRLCFSRCSIHFLDGADMIWLEYVRGTSIKPRRFHDNRSAKQCASSSDPCRRRLAGYVRLAHPSFCKRMMTIMMFLATGVSLLSIVYSGSTPCSG